MPAFVWPLLTVGATLVLLIAGLIGIDGMRRGDGAWDWRLRTGLVALNAGVLALTTAPWTTVDGVGVSAQSLAHDLVGPDYLLFASVVTLAALLAVAGRGDVGWVTVGLELLGCALVFRLMALFEAATGSAEMAAGSVATLLALVVGCLFASIVALGARTSHPNGEVSAFAKASGQAAYLAALKELAERLGAEYLPARNAFDTNLIRGRVGGRDFEIVDGARCNLARGVAGMRFEIRPLAATPTLLLVAPAAASAFDLQMNRGAAIDPDHPLRPFVNAPVVDTSGALGPGWIVKSTNTDEPRLHAILRTVAASAALVGKGWIVCKPDSIHFQTTFLIRPKYPADQMVGILNLLGRVARSAEDESSHPAPR